MGILNNFNLFYCFIAFIIGAVFMLVTLCIAAMGKVEEPRNNVHFYVTKNSKYYNYLQLWVGKPEWVETYDSWISRSIYVHFICNEYFFKYYKLNPNDFDNMKVGEIREVFLNLED